ncbi:MAG: hypothetical protein ABI120_18540 [Gemmatimonadaceae bacterium]
MASNRPRAAASDVRMPATRNWLFTVLAAAVLATGCRRATVDVPAKGSGVASTTQALADDTIRGVIRHVGNDPVSVLVLESRLGAVHSLRGTLLEALGRADGLEVMVRGTRTDQLDRSASPRGALIFEVKQFFVRGADGQIAIDGILNERDGTYFLISSSGERNAVPFLPQGLRGKVGSWVFLVGPLGQTPNAYGILSERK